MSVSLAEVQALQKCYQSPLQLMWRPRASLAHIAISELKIVFKSHWLGAVGLGSKHNANAARFLYEGTLFAPVEISWKANGCL